VSRGYLRLVSSQFFRSGRVRTRRVRWLLVATAAIVSVAALAGCGAAGVDLRASEGARAPAKANAAAKATPPPKGHVVTPEAPPPERTSEPRQPASGHKPAAPASARVVQQRLAALGYLPVDAGTGTWDARTRHAVLAFQAWEGLARDGIVGPQTLAALEKASRPTPAGNLGVRHVEVHREKGVTLLVEQGRVARAIQSSSGGGANATPAGSYSIFRKELNSWSVPYREWLPYASYFNAGIAFHAYPDVPAYPASHGCVRLPSAEAPSAYTFMSIGTPVAVY
jgi:lipoprotein-anchoring transpeptidase ErfK/SrfK